MPFKTKRIAEDRNRNELNKLAVKNPAFVDGNAATYIQPGQIVSVSGIDTGYLTVEEAIQGGQDSTLMVALNEIREFGIVTEWFILTADTSTGVAKADVWLDDGTAGDAVLVKPAGAAIKVGVILTAAVDGRILLMPGQGAADAGDTATAIADPGTGVPLPVTQSGSIAITTAGPETNTLPDPTFVGQSLMLFCDTYVGNRVVTADSDINIANNTVMTFGAAEDWILLQAITRGGSLVWRVVENEGVALS